MGGLLKIPGVNRSARRALTAQGRLPSASSLWGENKTVRSCQYCQCDMREEPLGKCDLWRCTTCGSDFIVQALPSRRTESIACGKGHVGKHILVRQDVKAPVKGLLFGVCAECQETRVRPVQEALAAGGLPAKCASCGSECVLPADDENTVDFKRRHPEVWNEATGRFLKGLVVDVCPDCPVCDGCGHAEFYHQGEVEQECTHSDESGPCTCMLFVAKLKENCS